MWDWLRRLCGMYEPPLLDDCEDLDVVTEGQLTYKYDVAFIEGTSLRDFMSGAVAAAAIWAGISKSTENMAHVEVRQQVYEVEVEVKMTFKPTKAPYKGPVFDASHMREWLQRSQGDYPFHDPDNRVALLMEDD